MVSEFPLESVTLTTFAPGVEEDGATKIKLENEPVASVIAFCGGGETAVPSNVTIKFELPAKPWPVIVTGIPLRPLVGVIVVMLGVTMKVAIAAL
jgi:hypothetical protein